MAHREFTDEHGRHWEAWEVFPTLVQEHAAEIRRLAIAPGLAQGWLAFRSDTERRRIAPIPAGWSTATEDGLRELLGRAGPISPVRRLVE
jgi:hypothetical protein